MPALNQPVSLSRVLQSEQSINERFELAVICEAGYGSHLLTRGVNGDKLKTHPILRSKLLAKGFYAQMGGERDNPTAASHDFERIAEHIFADGIKSGHEPNTVGIYSMVPLCSSLSMPIYKILMEEARWGAVSQAING